MGKIFSFCVFDICNLILSAVYSGRSSCLELDSSIPSSISPCVRSCTSSFPTYQKTKEREREACKTKIYRFLYRTKEGRQICTTTASSISNSQTPKYPHPLARLFIESIPRQGKRKKCLFNRSETQKEHDPPKKVHFIYISIREKRGSENPMKSGLDPLFCQKDNTLKRYHRPSSRRRSKQ